MRKFVFVVLLSLFSVASIAQITIQAGFEGGSYYRIAQDIGKIMTSPVTVLPSKGSLENFEKLPTSKQSGIDMVFLQFDVLYAGMFGLDDPTARQNYKVLLPLGKEDIHLITKRNSNINSLADLNGKRVGVGLTDQGTYVTALYVKRLVNGNWTDVEVSLDNSINALMDGHVDAFFFVAASPVAKLSNLPQAVGDVIKLVPLQHDSLQKLYSPITIKAESYSWQREAVKTHSLGYALVTNTANETDADRARYKEMLTSIKTNLPKLKAEGHAAWKDVYFSFSYLLFPVHQTTKEVFELK